MDIKLDKDRLIRLRKSRKLTQAEVVAKLGISLRRYSDYENVSTETNLSNLEISKLASALSVVVSELWGELPLYSATCFYHQTVGYDAWANAVAIGMFDKLKVDGIPSQKEHRQPLLNLLKMHESHFEENQPDKAESARLQRTFDCEDWVKQLVGYNLDESAQFTPPKLLIIRVPKLKIEKHNYHNEMTGAEYDSFGYEWEWDIRAKIDFLGNDPEAHPVSIVYVTGDHSSLFYFDEDGPDVSKEEMRRALESRRNHLADDGDVFLTEIFGGLKKEKDDKM